MIIKEMGKSQIGEKETVKKDLKTKMNEVFGDDKNQGWRMNVAGMKSSQSGGGLFIYLYSIFIIKSIILI